MYNWWYSIFPDLYVNSSLICFLDGYDLFMSKNFLSWRLQIFPVAYLYFLSVTNVSCHIPLFLDSYERFMRKTFFLNGCERFMSKMFLSWQLRTLHVKTPDSTNGTSCRNLSFPLFIPSLLSTYILMGIRLVTFQSLKHSNGFR